MPETTLSKANTQAVIARKLGVARQTVSDWFMHNAGTGKTHNHDSRVKDPVQANPVIIHARFAVLRLGFDGTAIQPMHDQHDLRRISMLPNNDEEHNGSNQRYRVTG